MNQQDRITDRDQTVEEDILTFSVSDEALEIAAGSEKGGANSVFDLLSIYCC